MLPQYHLVIGAVVAAILWPFLGTGGAVGLAAWALVGAAVGAVIDVDIMVLVALRARGEPALKHWSDPRNVARDFKGFLGMLRSTGLLRRAAGTHLLMGAALVTMFWALAPSLLVPALVGAVTHIASDLQYLSPPEG
jgi:hypothetical protein